MKSSSQGEQAVFSRAGSVLLFALALAGCGGGGDGVSSHQSLDVTITAAGTLARCNGVTTRPVRLTLQRDGTGPVALIDCPGNVLLRRDFQPSRWTLRDGELNVSESVVTTMPAPLLVQLGATSFVVSEPWLDQMPDARVWLQGRTADGVVVEIEPQGRQLFVAVPPEGAHWSALRWVVDVMTARYTSAEAVVALAEFRTIGVEGALAVGDLQATGRDELIGLSQAPALPTRTYQALGLGPLLSSPGRVFRDMRVADLDGDGLDDVVSNVYDGGCTWIGLNRGRNRFEWLEPRREDGSCLAGHGESIAIADFDGDGRLDIFIPFYERWDLLINQGEGRFVNVALDRDMAYPHYEPAAEGAVAVDIDLDGDVDIVVASEILLNDGSAHFTPVAQPYGVARLRDEGIFVADADGDGRFDIIKHHPENGPRVFWGRASEVAFEDSGNLLGVDGLLSRSFGLGAGDLTGNGLLDIVISGGDPGGTSPRLCVHVRPREFTCPTERWPDGHESRQDLLLVTDVDGDQRPDVLARFSPNTQKVVPSAARHSRFRFAFDLRTASGQRTFHGRSLRLRCAADGGLVGLAFVDGGNGFLSQGAYTVSAGSDHCERVSLELFELNGVRQLGAFGTGTHRVTVQAFAGG